MIDRYIIDFIKKNQVINQDQEQIIIFASQLIESTITSLGAIVLAGWLMGNLGETLIVLVAACTLRLAAGGPHCRTALHCALAGAVVFPVLGLIPKYYKIESYWLLFLLMIVSIICVVKYAPAEAPGKPLTNKKYIKKMYWISLIISVLISFLALFFFHTENKISTGLIIGLIWQALTITPVGYKFAAGLDHLIYTIIRR